MVRLVFSVTHPTTLGFYPINDAIKLIIAAENILLYLDYVFGGKKHHVRYKIIYNLILSTFK